MIEKKIKEEEDDVGRWERGTRKNREREKDEHMLKRGESEERRGER